MSLRPFQRMHFDDLPETPRRSHPFFSFASREVHVRGRKVTYREHGSGPPLLLIHGLMTSSYSWRYVMAPLATRFRVIAPDLPGAGASEAAPPGEYAAESLAAWILELQRALAIDGCVAIGNSMGGYLAMRLALDEPRAFSRLVNIHSPAFPDAKLRALATLLTIPGTRALVARLARRDPRRWAHKNVHYFDETLKSHEEARAYGDPLATTEGGRAFTAYLAETMAPRGLRDFTHALAASTFPVPLLLVYARTDPLVSPDNGPRLHALVPASTLTWIDDSSHFAHVDTPDAVVDAVVPFLEGR